MQITKSLMSLSVATLSGAVVSLMGAEMAQAVTFTFDAGDDNLSTIVKTVDGCQNFQRKNGNQRCRDCTGRKQSVPGIQP